ncbi:MAG TPA: hypothetical protein VF972_06985, partial [Actinomycetota bacterium]
GVVGTIAYNALTGRKAWVAQFSVQGQILNWGCCLALDSSGSTLFVAGTTSWSGYDYLTLSYNAQDGVLNWASHYGGLRLGEDSVLSLAVSRGPTARGTLVFVTGLSEEHQGTNGMVTLAYAAGF